MHVPKVQTCPTPHTVHRKPEFPQACVLLPTWHAPLASQHPLVQVAGEHAFVVEPPQAVKDDRSPTTAPTRNERIMARSGALLLAIGEVRVL